METFYSQKAGLSLDLWFRFKVQVEKMQLWPIKKSKIKAGILETILERRFMITVYQEYLSNTVTR